MFYTAVAYQLTDKCNAKCKMCGYASGPQSKNKLNKDIVLKSIDSIKDIPRIMGVGVTGGEPFLYPDDVLAMAEHTKNINRSFTISTNAFWCGSYSRVFDILSQLKKNNLSNCLVSTDAFHEEYIPIERVKIFLRVCRDLRIPVTLQTRSTQSTFLRTDEIIGELGIDKMYTEVQLGAVYPVGAANDYLELENFFTGKLERAFCSYQHTLLIAADGRALPCCNISNSNIPFELGNIYSDSLNDILKKTKENELLRMMVSKGFSELLKEANKELGYKELEEYVDACHLCNHLLSDIERYSYLKEKARDWEKKERIIAGAINW